MREYHLPDGSLVPAELQEIIAEDVRDFDKAQTPEARSAAALRKISNELPRLRSVLAGTGEEQTTAVRRTVALEISALAELGFTPEVLQRTPQARLLMHMYGLIDEQSEGML